MSRRKLPPPTEAEIDRAVAQAVTWFTSHGHVFTRDHVIVRAADFGRIPCIYLLPRMHTHWDGLFGGITYDDIWQVTPAVAERIEAITAATLSA